MRMQGFIGVWCLACTTVSCCVEAQERKVIGARRDSTTIFAIHPRIIDDGAHPKIDGDLSDKIWGTADVATLFTQVRPSGGSSSGQRTEARVLLSNDALYVAMRMYDTAPDSIAAQLGRCDAFDLYSDWARVLINGNFSGRTAVEFAVNPRGVKADGYWYDDTNENPAWDAVWDVATRIDSLGWTAEFRIPLAQLRTSRHANEAGSTWGVQFIRDIARYNETDAWSPIPADGTGFVSRFGRLQGVGLPNARGHLEIAPYAVTSTVRAPGDRHDPFYERQQLKHSFSADVKYTPRADMTINAKVNPDFGQVEADLAVVNLTEYQLFFPEERPFFVADADLFQEGIATADVFYSRRIGRPPEIGIPGDAVYSDIPAASRIVAAVKASHRTGDGWSFGVLDAVTQLEVARYTDTLPAPY